MAREAFGRNRSWQDKKAVDSTVFHGRPDLLQRFRDGEPGAFEEVYRGYVDGVRGIVRYGFRLPTPGTRARGVFERPEDIADLVQEVFLRAFAPAARAGFDGQRDYGPYLFAIARNVVVDWARRQGREVPTSWPDLEAIGSPAEYPANDEDALDSKTRAIIDTYLDGLDSDLRAVHEARYRHGLSQQKAAAALGLSRQSLRTLEDRLRTGLRRAIKRHPFRAW